MLLNDESVWIKKAADGDADAFGRLVLKYQTFVYNICYQSLRNREDAYDVSQEIFIKAYKAVTSFRGDSSFSTWLYKISVNAIKDYVAKEYKRKTLSLQIRSSDDEDDIEIDVQDTDRNSDPELSTERNETVNAVRAAIAELPDIYREMIVLRDIENFSYEEISEMTALELGTVKSRLNRARKQLKEILENGNFFSDLPSNSQK